MLNRKLLPVTVCALALSVAPGLASAQTNGSGSNADSKEMSKAWFEYIKAVDTVTKELQASASYVTDPTGMIDIQTGMMITNVLANMSSAASGPRGNRPRWGFFDTPETRIGIDNPDTRYLSAVIQDPNGDQVFRVEGNRSNTCDMITLINDGTNPQGGGDTLEDEDMLNTSGGVLGPDEDFDIYISTAAVRDPSWFNWLQIPDGTTSINVSQRYTVCNYHTERPGDISIERVGTEGVAITAQEFRNVGTLTEGINRATATLVNQQPFWGTFSESLINSPLPVNVASPWAPTGGLGITSQLSSLAHLTIPDNQALILKVRTDLPGAYGSWQLFNAWGSSLPWGHHMANGSFEIAGSAGNSYFIPSTIVEPIPPQLGGGSASYTYIVISKDDPGTNNWIGTMGHETVFLAGRLQSVLDPADFAKVQGRGPWMPIAYTVPIQAIFPGSPALPADMAFVTPAQRSDQIRERQVYQAEKYAPW